MVCNNLASCVCGVVVGEGCPAVQEDTHAVHTHLPSHNIQVCVTVATKGDIAGEAQPHSPAFPDALAWDAHRGQCASPHTMHNAREPKLINGCLLVCRKGGGFTGGRGIMEQGRPSSEV
jgi:hypothetical protein